MANISLEVSTRWTGLEAKEKIAELQNQTLDLGTVLKRFSPDHVHGSWEDQPWLFRHIYKSISTEELRSRNNNELDNEKDLAQKIFIAYLKTRGIYAERVSLRKKTAGMPFRDQFIVMRNLNGAPLWSPRETLRYPLIDFFVLFKSPTDAAVIDTNRVPGVEGDFYKVNVKALNGLNTDGVISERGQDLVSAMLAARV
ncbi:MAG: hypothetical protein Q7R49_01285 [Candidatus Daviesbacteria bacterium]|nr:hypothetical protein [Candidatus Daviesbacteria bacterium]